MTVGPHGPHGGLHAITPPRNGPHAYKIPNRNPDLAGRGGCEQAAATSTRSRRRAVFGLDGKVPQRSGGNLARLVLRRPLAAFGTFACLTAARPAVHAATR